MRVLVFDLKIGGLCRQRTYDQEIKRRAPLLQTHPAALGKPVFIRTSP